MQVHQLNWKDTIPIRHQVLWPNEKPEYCRVEGDEEALHFGVSINDQLISVASLYIDKHSARLRKFATLEEFQGQGVGTFLLNHLIVELKTYGINYLWFDVRESAIGFYRRFGFETEGQRFYKSHVAYFKMSAHF